VAVAAAAAAVAASASVDFTVHTNELAARRRAHCYRLHVALVISAALTRCQTGVAWTGLTACDLAATRCPQTRSSLLACLSDACLPRQTDAGPWPGRSSALLGVPARSSLPFFPISLRAAADHASFPTSYRRG